MKPRSINNTLAFIMLITIIPSCTPSKKEDSTEVAKEANAETFETRKGEKEADFIVDALAGNYAEIKLAQAALSQSSSPEIKELAIMLETDHTALITQLKAYATSNGISVPLEETEEAKKDIKNLVEKTGEDFDKKWCSTLIDKHEKTIMRFEDRWNETEDTELKNWINATLPTLHEHLEMLKAHAEKVKDSK